MFSFASTKLSCKMVFDFLTFLNLLGLEYQHIYVDGSKNKNWSAHMLTVRLLFVLHLCSIAELNSSVTNLIMMQE